MDGEGRRTRQTSKKGKSHKLPTSEPIKEQSQHFIEENEIDELPDSPENSTENTRKKVLPTRRNRGLRLNALKGRELEEENEYYNQIFADRDSDEEFDPDADKLSKDDSFDSDFGKVDNTVNNESALNVHTKTTTSSRRNRNSNSKEEIIDLDDLDIDLIDNMDNDDYENEDNDEEGAEEDEDEGLTSKKKKGIASGKNKRLNGSKGLKLGSKKTDSNNVKPKRYSKAFIDEDDEDEDFKRKRKRTFKTPTKPLKKAKLKQLENETTVIVNKSILNEKNYHDILEYNDDSYFTNKQLEEETKKEKTKLRESNISSKYGQDKLTQKDLLFEAIFTEMYNQKSLEELQRLEELNKKDISTSNKKSFVDYVRSVKKCLKEPEANIEIGENNEVSENRRKFSI